ncbi:hypothetical protein HYU23_02455, partial [Candidatus Woesearchaeota archaeon]|nr:hypothetical protein [Candidatus Woesearchaeota archaeon]
ITGIKLADSSVNTTHILDGTVAVADLAQASVNSSHLALNAVNTSHVVVETLIADDIANRTITGIKLATDSVNATHIDGLLSITFGTCTIDVPIVLAGFSNISGTEPTNPVSNCSAGATASTGSSVIIMAQTPALDVNLTLAGARVVGPVGGANITLNFSVPGSIGGVAPTSQNFVNASNVTFAFIVFANGTG